MAVLCGSGIKGVCAALGVSGTVPSIRVAFDDFKVLDLVLVDSEV